MKFIMLINVKMPTNVGILIFIRAINTTSEKFQARKIFSASMCVSDKTSNYIQMYGLLQKKPRCFIMRKQKRRSASTSTQSDRRICIRCLDSAIAYIQSVVLKTSKSGGLTMSLMFCNETNESVQISRFRISLYTKQRTNVPILRQLCN